MDDKTYYGSLAETKVIAELTKQKYHVFNQISGKAPFDIVAYQNSKLFRVDIKSVEKKNAGGSYTVQIGKIRANKKTNNIYKFDNLASDILAVYLVDTDKICFIPSLEITTGRCLTLREARTIFSKEKQFVIADYMLLNG